MPQRILQTNVPTTTVAASTIPVAGIDSAQYSVTRTAAGEKHYTNVMSPLGLPLTTDIKHRIISNIYNNANHAIAAANRLPSAQGVSLHVARHYTFTFPIDDDQDTTATCCNEAPEWVAPAWINMTIGVPNNPLVTEAIVKTMISDMLGLLLNVDGKSKLAAYLRGALDL